MVQWSSIFLYFTMICASKETRVYDKQGVILLRDGTFAGFSNINVMDLEVRISRPDLFIPEVVKLTNDAYDGLLSGSLNPESFKKGYADIKSCWKLWNSTVEDLRQLVRESESTAKFEVMADETLDNVIAQSARRNRRSAEAPLVWLGKNVWKGLFGPGQEDKLASLRKNINTNMPHVKKALRKELTIAGETVVALQNLNRDLNVAREEEDCEIQTVRYFERQVTKCIDYGKSLLEMSFRERVGFPQGFLTHEIADKITENPAFNNTIFQDYPLLIKNYVNIHLERMHVSNNGTVFSYIVYIPNLLDYTIFPLYKTLQSGFYQSGLCRQLLLPDYVVLVNGLIMDFDCNNKLGDLCGIGPSTLRSSCIENSNCSSTAKFCEPYSFINSIEGLLVASLNPIKAMKVTSTGRRNLVAITPSGNTSVSFVPWNVYQSAFLMPDGFEVQPPGISIGHVVIDTYSGEVTPIDIDITSSSFDSKGYLENIHRHLKETQSILRNISTRVNDQELTSQSSSLWTSISLGIHSLWTILVIYVIYKAYKCLCKTQEGSEQ